MQRLFAWETRQFFAESGLLIDANWYGISFEAIFCKMLPCKLCSNLSPKFCLAHKTNFAFLYAKDTLQKGSRHLEIS